MGNVFRPKVIGVVLLVLLVMVGSAFVIPVPLPAIILPAEPIFCIGGQLVEGKKGLACEGGFPFTNSMLATLMVDLTLLVIFVTALRNMELVPRGLQNAVEALIEFFYGFTEDVAGKENAPRFFPLVMTIFIFTLVANWWELVPGIESVGWITKAHGEGGWAKRELLPGFYTLVREPGEYILVPWLRTATTDLNVPLSMALVTMVYVQISGVRALGLAYFKRFINFNSFMDFMVGILEIISEFAKIISFSFRLFGNLFAGTVLLFVMPYLVPLLVPLPFFALEVFVGLIQAFVFAALALVFLSIAVISHDHH